MGDDIPPVNAREVIPPPAPPKEGIPRDSMSRVNIFLQENSRIGMLRTHYDKYRRYAQLNMNSIFNSLVMLYLPLFKTLWPRLRRYMDEYPPPQGLTGTNYAARIYISAWVRDLYVSNREAVMKLSPLAFAQHYDQEAVYTSLEYDEFLIRLNAAIRPTNIRGLPEDTLYIPLLAENVELDSDNPFNINNYTYNYDCVTGLIGLIRDSKAWKLNTIVSNVVGRPSWLFDWHDIKCCAWFPAEGNFSMDDVTLAYIVGVPCTPKLGQRDVDDWQDYPNNVVPQSLVGANLARLTARRFYGGYEIRTFDERQVMPAIMPPPDPKGKGKGKTKATKQQKTGITITEPTAQEEATSDTSQVTITEPINQFRINDWTYYHLVVLNLDIHTRSGALKSLVTGS